MILSIGVLLLLGLGILSGFRAGFVLQLVRLIIGILSWIIAIFTSGPIADFIYQLVGNGDSTMTPRLFTVVVFAIVFLVANGLLWRLGHLLNLVTKLPVIHFLNGILGAVFGFLLRYILVFILLNILVLIPTDWIQSQYNDSQLSQTIVTQTPIISNQLLQQWQDSIQQQN